MNVKKSSILIVEDESDIRQLIALHLKREGYAVSEAADGAEALRRIQTEPFDLYVLDWMLPQVSGLDLIRAIRSERKSVQIPILMVTARMEATDIVMGLEAGADDYVTKPFQTPVLLARVRALLRRAEGTRAQGEGEQKPGSLHSFGKIRVDEAAHEVHCGKELIQLTPSEFKLLAALAKNRGRVLTRQSLIDLVQGSGVSVVDRAIDTHVFGLRKKLGPCGEMIETVRGVGYRVRGE